jgi:hypothetical protein
MRCIYLGGLFGAIDKLIEYLSVKCFDIAVNLNFYIKTQFHLLHEDMQCLHIALKDLDISMFWRRATL